MIRTHILTSALLATQALCSYAQQPDGRPLEPVARSFEWDARSAEHLLNRAGFGARPAEIQRWVEAGPEALVDHLFAARTESEPFFVEDPASAVRELRGGAGAELSEQERRKLRGAVRQADRKQLQAYLEWWVRHMLESSDPLRDRMTLFWHSFFTSGYQTVKSSRMMIEQNLFLRENAMGSYATMLTGIVKDPAMLRYLDNNTNQKRKPNENLAREVMELFSLGEGNYSEHDVQEAARALTGHTFLPNGDYRFVARRHDYGPKEILGRAGRHDAADLAAILLEQDACARFVAGELLEYFEGAPPAPGRVQRYAALLRDSDYGLEPVLRTLFLDPDFYREEIVGARIASPIDYLVGSARRLGLRTPPRFVLSGSALLGQQLFEPPNVKGWEEGEAWITTSSLMLRGNLMGMLLGEVDLRDLDGDTDLELLAELQAQGRAEEDQLAMDGRMVDQPDDPTMDGGAMTGEAMAGETMTAAGAGTERGPARAAAQRKPSELQRILRAMTQARYRPPVNLVYRVGQAGLRDSGAIVDYLLDELLAIEAPPETRALLIEHLEHERERLRLGRRLPRKPGERVLRRLAHLILSLPEAQLN